MKTCSKCKRALPIDQFHKAKQNKDGLKGQCKRCRYLHEVGYRNKPKTKEHRRAYSKQVRQTAKRKLYDQFYQQKDKTRKQCRGVARYMMKTGKIKKRPCAVCGSSKSEMHHANYEFPNAVTWLCKQHHEQEHLTNQWLI